MNILEQEDIIKGLPDQALQEEAKAPSGQVPQFLVVSEIQRRTDMRKKYQDPSQQQPQGTVANQITQEGIASVQPQQPMQGQPMPMRGGGMTPFMRKYAGGGVVRMQEGGITPNEMLQMDAQMMAQKYPFLSGSRDEILQGLSGIDPNDAGSISAMFGGAPEIDGVLQQVSNRNNLMSQDFSGGLGPAPMVENITPQSELILDGVMTSTPDGQRPNPNAESLGSLDSFANAFREDAARAENLLATLDDSTAKEKEAISNPVNVNLPQIRTLEEIGRDAPQMLPLAARKAPKNELATTLENIYTGKGANVTRQQIEQETAIGQKIGNVASGIDSSVKKGILDVGEYVTGDLADSLTAGDFSSPYEAGRTISASATQPISFLADKLGDGYQGAYNLTAGMLEPIEDLGRGLVGADERQGKGFRYDTPRGLFQQDNSGKTFYFDGSDSKSSDATSSDPERTGTARSLIDFSEQQGSPSRQQLIANSQSVKPPVAQDNSSVTISDSDGANSEGSGDKSAKGANNSASIMDRVLGLNLDGAQKEAYAMAMIQLGAGIAKGDLAEGLSNAGVAASGVLEKSRDRAGKQMDREIQQKYYDAKLNDAQQVQDFRRQQAINEDLTDWAMANIGATPEELETKRQELSRQYQVLGNTTATGSNIGGGNQRSSANIDFNSLNT